MRRICTVSTYNYLHVTLAMARSLARRWPTAPRLVVALVDGEGLERPGFDELDVEFVPVEQLKIPNFMWLAAKYTPGDLCCAIKPFLVRHLLAQGHGEVLYCDSDQMFFGDGSEIFNFAPTAQLVGTAHLHSPIPRADWRCLPRLGDLAHAGLLNAGLFLARQGAESAGFLATWSELVAGPGAFLPELGGQTEQHAFNWAPAFMHGFALFDDLRFNIAYWNVHERPIRWAALDGGDPGLWLLDGTPIATFHFSGFDLEHDRLSHFSGRDPLLLNLNLDALAHHYDQALEAAHRAHYAATPYGYGSLAGVALTPDLRLELRRAELATQPWWAAWPEDLKPLLAVLLAAPGSSVLLPRCLERIWNERPDLRALAGHEGIQPSAFLSWCIHHLPLELPSYAPLAAPDACIVDRRTVAALTARSAPFLPKRSLERLFEDIVWRRPELLQDLALANAPPDLSREIVEGLFLIPCYVPAQALRLLYDRSPELRRRFRDPLGTDLDDFRAWLAGPEAAHLLMPPAMAAFLERFDLEHSLACILAGLRQHPSLLTLARAWNISHALLSALVGLAGDGSCFSADDLVLVKWWVDLRGSRGTPPWSRHRMRATAQRLRMSPRVRAFFGRDTPARGRTPMLARLGDAAAVQLRRLDKPVMDKESAKIAEILAGRPRAVESVPAESQLAQGSRSGAGVNLFGYFKSPIGLGSASVGVRNALALAGFATRDITLCNMTMVADLRPEDLLPDFEPRFTRNLVVSYPHINHDLTDIFPASYLSGRETIGYLAWEQRDLHPRWLPRLAAYDRLFALSRFSADAIAQASKRPCEALPCVVQVDEARARRFSRADFDLPAGDFLVGCFFDASSSIERKNPAGATAALVRAFARRGDVTVVLKVTNGDRPQFAKVIDPLVRALRDAGIGCRLVTKVLRRAELEGLMAQLDLYISLHRAEGFGYTLAEAMWLGVPTVASAYSGNLDFMNERNSGLVRCRETVVRLAEGPFQLGTVWGDPDLAQAAELCDWVYRERDAAQARAVVACNDIRGFASVEAVARRCAQLLDPAPIGAVALAD